MTIIRKNKTGKIIGFILGMTFFLFIFKFFFLDHIPPEDEVPPGLVLIASVLNGLVFAFAGNLIQNYFEKKQTKPKQS